ncbi:MULTISPECIES: oligosaccharide flippase family protein [Cetobacterium]|jgi:O-antigen/teichoic acid export membrane protein|uniref:Oligosaccharide flippase family protein n=1 Tax=Candidatus Cetobacterium colombiensis TaxID=3073100 RepID=A0ABU4W957_9FUSO|nr:oligosaccharide flippase family protein [Candidatus Cetobacterium colombiensis]MDX8335690.1 oligosaccharide flippase family protein [Candidatus Cetobacterium colombiensis]
MARNELKIGTALSMITIIASSFIQILYTPLYMRYLGPGDYGINSLVQSIMGYISILNLGLGNAMLRYTVRYRAEGKIEEENSLNGMFLVIYSILMSIAFIIGIYIYVNLGKFFGSRFSIEELSKTKAVFLIMSLNIILSFPMGIFSTNITSREKFLYQRGIKLITIVLNPIMGAILMINGYGLIAVTVSTVIFAILSYMFDIVYALKLGMKIKFSKFDNRILREIFTYSFFIFLNVLIDQIYWGTDRVIIGRYVGVGGIAIYSVGAIFNTLYMGFASAVSGVLFPRINRLIVEEKHDEVNDMFLKIGRLQYILLGLISSGFIIFGKDFITLWVGKEYIEAYKIALWIMIPLTVPLIQSTGVSIMQAKNMHQFRSVVYFIIAILNLVLSIIFVKKVGAIGCAIATGLSFILGQIIIMNIYYQVSVKLNMFKFWKSILKMSLPMILTMGFGYVLNMYLIEINYFIFTLKVIIYTSVYVGLLWILGLNDYEKSQIYIWKK